MKQVRQEAEEEELLMPEVVEEEAGPVLSKIKKLSRVGLGLLLVGVLGVAFTAVNNFAVRHPISGDTSRVIEAMDIRKDVLWKVENQLGFTVNTQGHCRKDEYAWAALHWKPRRATGNDITMLEKADEEYAYLCVDKGITDGKEEVPTAEHCENEHAMTYDGKHFFAPGFPQYIMCCFEEGKALMVKADDPRAHIDNAAGHSKAKPGCVWEMSEIIKAWSETVAIFPHKKNPTCRDMARRGRPLPRKCAH